MAVSAIVKHVGAAGKGIGQRLPEESHETSAMCGRCTAGVILEKSQLLGLGGFRLAEFEMARALSVQRFEVSHWALRVSNPRPSGCKADYGALAYRKNLRNRWEIQRFHQ